MIDIKRIRSTELEILLKIDSFCRENGLKYSLTYGTLIGAIRHKGFIPWDDDVDIMMPRNDYNYLIKNWNIPGYIVQNKYSNDDFSQSFTKIRKDNTTFIQLELEKTVSYHTGIFVDVFPIDRIAPNYLLRKAQLAYCAINLLYAREGVVSRKLSLVEKAFMALPHSIRLKVFKWSDKEIQKWNGYNTPLFEHATMGAVNDLYPADLFDSLIDIEFEKMAFMCVACFDEVLKTHYGDYMQLPPIEERVYRHQPIVVNFDQNYNNNHEDKATISSEL